MRRLIAAELLRALANSFLIFQESFKWHQVVFSADWGPAVSKNPFLQFSVKGAKAGDKITVEWVDNKGEKRTDTATVS